MGERMCLPLSLPALITPHLQGGRQDLRALNAATDGLSLWRCSQAMGSFMVARGIIFTLIISTFIKPAQVPSTLREETQLR